MRGSSPANAGSSSAARRKLSSFSPIRYPKAFWSPKASRISRAASPCSIQISWHSPIAAHSTRRRAKMAPRVEEGLREWATIALFPLLDEAFEIVAIEQQLPQLATARERHTNPREDARPLEVAHGPLRHAEVRGRGSEIEQAHVPLTGERSWRPWKLAGRAPSRLGRAPGSGASSRTRSRRQIGRAHV